MTLSRSKVVAGLDPCQVPASPFLPAWPSRWALEAAGRVPCKPVASAPSLYFSATCFLYVQAVTNHTTLQGIFTGFISELSAYFLSFPVCTLYTTDGHMSLKHLFCQSFPPTQKHREPSPIPAFLSGKC